jgi:hypothetical protein
VKETDFLTLTFKKPTLMKSIFAAVFFLSIISCTSKKTTEENVQTQDAPTTAAGLLDGDYEFYAGAVDDGYLYYKLSLTQKGNDLSGSLFTGIYLSKNDQGYTMPTATMTSSITGQLGNSNEVMFYLGAPIDTSRMDKNYKFPEPEKIFDGDANGDSVAGARKVGDRVQWIHNGDTLVFIKVAATSPQ